MSTPIPELIALEIVERLEAITEGNGYEFTTPAVTRVSRDGRTWTPEHNAIVVVQGDQERTPEHDRPGNPPANAYTIPFAITGYIRKPEHQEYADWSDINIMESEIKKALAASGTPTWRTFAGNAYNSMWGSVSYPRSASTTGVTVELNVMYRNSEDDPYTARN